MDAAAHLQEGLVPNMVAAGNAAHNHHLPRQQHQEQHQQQQQRQPAETVASSTSSQTAVHCFNTAPQPQDAAPATLVQESMYASAPADVPQQQQQQQQHLGAALPQVAHAPAVAWLAVWAPAAALQPAAPEAAAAAGGGGGVAGADAIAAADAAAAAIMNDMAAADPIGLIGDGAFLGWVGDAWLPEMVAVDALLLQLMGGLRQQVQQQQLLQWQQQDPQEPSTPSQMAGLLNRGWTQELRDSLPKSNTVAAGA